MLTIEHLSIGYTAPRTPTYVVAEAINLTLNEGELVCLLGPNGAGKSTLMRTIAGMQAPLSGSILIDGQNIHDMPARERAKRLSVVLTERVNAGLLSGYAMVGLGRYPHTNWSGTLGEADHEVIQWAIRVVGAEELAHRNVSDLSDGERQKIMLARALAQEPRMMILDEITAFLDLPRRVEAMRLLRRMARETNRAILISTHDLDLALRSADRIWLLPKGGPLQTGAPEDLVLSGAFEAAFANEGVDFDRQHGAFRVHNAVSGHVSLQGGGILRYWTQRALEREGLAIHATPSADRWHIEIHDEADATQWHLHRGEQRSQHPSLSDLTAHLRHLQASPAAWDRQ
ncbi:MAG: ABC transporter ATP-binding protein [Bacteroidota bacterium]